MNSHFGSWNHNGLSNLQKVIAGIKAHWMECSLYHWKALDEGYNFVVYLVSIGGLHTKLWASKVAGIPTLGISGLPLGSPGTKCHLDASLVARHRLYYNGEGGGFPKFGLWWNLWVKVCSRFICAPKVLQLCINRLVVWFVQVHVSDWSACHLPSPIPEL